MNDNKQKGTIIRNPNGTISIKVDDPRARKWSAIMAENRRRLENRKHEPTYLKPGIYTQTISGHPCNIDKAVNSFHKSMYRDYNGYEVINTATYPMPDGVCFYITYRIGTPRAATTTTW